VSGCDAESDGKHATNWMVLAAVDDEEMAYICHESVDVEAACPRAVAFADDGTLPSDTKYVAVAPGII
jgi:hypothetical protein